MPDVLRTYEPLLNISKEGTATATGRPNDALRDGQEIQVVGFRLMYCMRSMRAVEESTARATYVRMMLVEDKFARDGGISEGTNMFSGLGGIIPSGDFQAGAKAGLDFSAVKPACTKFVQPLNSKRYRIIWQKRMKLQPAHYMSEVSRVGKWWIPYNKKVKYGALDYLANSKFTDPHVKFLYFYERADSSKEGVTLNMDLKWMTYFKNK